MGGGGEGERGKERRVKGEERKGEEGNRSAEEVQEDEQGPE